LEGKDAGYSAFQLLLLHFQQKWFCLFSLPALFPFLIWENNKAVAPAMHWLQGAQNKRDIREGGNSGQKARIQSGSVLCFLVFDTYLSNPS